MYRKKINKINKKYFSGLKTGENFKKFKSYRLVLYKKKRGKRMATRFHKCSSRDSRIEVSGKNQSRYNLKVR